MENKYTEGGIKTVWTTDITLFLLDLWEENIGAGCDRKNVLIYKNIAEEMSCFGPTSAEVKNKIKYLTRRFRREAAKAGNSNWVYYDKIKAILSSHTVLCDCIDSTLETTDRDEDETCSSNSRKRKASTVEKPLERGGKNPRIESVAEDGGPGIENVLDLQKRIVKDSTRGAEHSFDQLVKLKEMDEKLQVRLKQMDIDGMLKVKQMELEMKKIELEADERLRKMELELKYKYKSEL